MASALTAEDAGRLVTLVAPGYFAHAAYSARFPQRKRDELPLLIASIAASLPLVAVANALSDAVGIARSPTALLYVAILIGCSLGAGYLIARVWDTHTVRGILTRYVQLGEPETAVALRVLPRLPKKHLVTVFFKDGRRLSGSVRFGGDHRTPRCASYSSSTSRGGRRDTAVGAATATRGRRARQPQ
jgi:hypothetical protein